MKPETGMWDGTLRLSLRPTRQSRAPSCVTTMQSSLTRSIHGGEPLHLCAVVRLEFDPEYVSFGRDRRWNRVPAVATDECVYPAVHLVHLGYRNCVKYVDKFLCQSSSLLHQDIETSGRVKKAAEEPLFLNFREICRRKVAGLC